MIKRLNDSMKYRHVPVLKEEVLKLFEGKRRILDATIGLGGHSAALLQADKNRTIVGMDQDSEALEVAKKNLRKFGERVELVQMNFRELDSQLSRTSQLSHQGSGFDGIMADLGGSSLQLDKGDRGFSFQQDAPLDMRMDGEQELTATEIVNNYSAQDLATLLWDFGEERLASLIAKEIVKVREQSGAIVRTSELADLVRSVYARHGWRQSKVHPATKTFQALRLQVNGELAALETFLPQAVRLLASDGLIVVISFHSLEDRIVKRFFAEQSRGCVCPPDWPECRCKKAPVLRTGRPKFFRASAAEIQDNPRARSAILRWAIKV